MPLITFPLALSATAQPRSVLFLPDSVVSSARSPFTRQEQVQVYPGQQWLLTVEYPPLPPEIAADLLADLTALNGREGTFLFHPWTVRRGAASGTPLVDGADQTGTDLATKGWTPSVPVLRKNDYIGFGSGASSRVHTVLQDVTSDGDGKAVIPVWPKPRAAYADEAPLTVTDPMAVFRLNENKRTWARDLVSYGITIEATEALA